MLRVGAHARCRYSTINASIAVVIAAVVFPVAGRRRYMFSSVFSVARVCLGVPMFTHLVFCILFVLWDGLIYDGVLMFNVFKEGAGVGVEL